jgi:hypothetical protein
MLSGREETGDTRNNSQRREAEEADLEQLNMRPEGQAAHVIRSRSRVVEKYVQGSAGRAIGGSIWAQTPLLILPPAPTCEHWRRVQQKP